MKSRECWSFKVSFIQASSSVVCFVQTVFPERYVTQYIAFDTILKCHVYHELTDTKFCIELI